MKKEDYQTIKRATDYRQKRFSDGLATVSADEITLLDRWLNFINPEPKSARSYLDLGAGTGRITGELLRQKSQVVYALDSSQAMLSLLQRTYAKELKKQKLKTLNASSDKIPLAGGSIDLITAFHLFKHLPDIGPTLKEAYRVLKAGGHLVFDALNKNSLVRLRSGTCFMLSESEINTRLKEIGFTVLDLAFIHPLGETPYHLFGKSGATVIHLVDAWIVRAGFKAGTKIFALAKKNE